MVHFIEVAEQCKVLNNFNATMEILSGLGDSAIHRLKNHWSELPKKSQTIYADLKAIMNSDKSFASFRAYLRAAEQPCIPYLGMYLTDLTFIEDGNQDIVSDLPNFFKRRLIATVISEIQQYQQTPYHFDEAPSIKKFLLNADLLDKETAYQRSLLILPRGGQAQSNVVLAPIRSSSNANVSGDDDDEFGEMEEIPNYPYNDKDTNNNIRLEKGNDALSTPIVTAATLPKVIERLSNTKFPQDTQLLDAFLLGYRSVITGKQLIDLIILRFNMPKPKNPALVEKFIKTKLISIQARLVNIFKSWCEKFAFDFMVDRELYQTFSEFVETCNNNNVSSKEILKRISHSLQQNIKAIKSGNVVKNCQPHKSAPPPLFPLRRGSNKNIPKFIDFHHDEVARALTIYDFDLFYKIMPQELLSNNYQTSKSRSPFLYQFVKRSKTIHNWVNYEVALFPHENIDQRIEILAHIINIAKSLENMNNYQSAYSIVSALQSNEISALLQTWDNLPKKVIEKYQQLQQRSNRALADYKQFKEKNPETPVIPPIQVYLRQIHQIDEKEKEIIDENKNNSFNLVNIKKKLQLQDVVNDLFKCKTYAFNFETYSWLQNYVKYGIEKHAEDDPYEELDKNPLLADIGMLTSYFIFIIIIILF